MNRTDEAAFETVIEAHLLQNGYVRVPREGFDRDRAIFPETVLAFIRETLRHRGLERFFEKGDTRGLHPSHIVKIRRILTRLNAAASLSDLSAPGLRLHPLKGAREGEWAVDVDQTGELPLPSTGATAAV